MIRNVTLYVVGYIQEFSPDISTELENSFMTIEWVYTYKIPIIFIVLLILK